MIHVLPAEIVGQIESYLSQSEYVQLISVNRTYHARYLPKLYNDVLLYSTDTLAQFTKAFKYHRHVQNLDLCRMRPEKSFLEALPVSFPFLISLRFALADCCKYGDITFCQPFSHLTSLTLRAGYSEYCLLNIIAAMRCLKRLCLTEISKQACSVKLLDDIHQACPYLESLHLESCFSIEPDDHKPESSFICNRLKSFTVEFCTYAPYQLWLRYVASRYPHIEILKLKYKNESQSITDSYSEEFYDWFWSSCPRLVNFEWHGIVPDEAFLKRLNYQQRQLQKLTIKRLDLIRLYLFKTSLSHHMHLSAILNLEISLLPDIDYNTFLSCLNASFPQLQQLKLYEPFWRTPKEMDLSAILGLFPYLQFIGLKGIQLTDEQCTNHQQQHNDTITHSLSTIVFEKCRFDCVLLEYIALRCPKLRQIIIDGKSKNRHHLTRKSLLC